MFIQITGAREWSDKRIITEALFDAMGDVPNPSDHTVRHGKCRGVDILAGEIAKFLGCEVDEMPAEWRNHEGCRCNEWRKAHSYCGFAGPRRNRQMLDKTVDVVLAFHPSITESKGTKDCVNEAVRRGMRVLLYDSVGNCTEVKEVIP